MASFPDTAFQYEPLPTPTSIRVLLLSSADPCDPGVVRGEPLMRLSLKVIDLNHRPEFEALSYTWGCPFPEEHRQAEYDPETNKLPVLVNDRLFHVAPNLYEFLSQQRNVDRTNKTNEKTPLMKAAIDGRRDDVRWLLEQGADIMTRDGSGKTALHYAAENGYPSIVRLLVRWGADFNQLDYSGRTPVQCAKTQRRLRYEKLVRFLESEDLQQLNPRVTQSFECKYSPIWIDAICINQSNVQERNSQVAMMCRIYIQASKVLVWLGKEDDHARNAYRLLHEPQGESTRSWIGQMIKYSKTNEFAASPMQTLRLFFQRTWFTRSWVIQEFALARRIEIYCGDMEFDLPIISRTIDLQDQWFVRSLAGLEHSESSSSTAIFGEHWASMKDIRKMYMEGSAGGRLTLPILLSMTSHSKSTDPRDRIYALLGIVNDSFHCVVPDYTKPTSEVFTFAAKMFLRGSGQMVPISRLQTGDASFGGSSKIAPTSKLRTHSTCPLELLEGLSFIRDTRSNQFSTPSWVPDFTNLTTSHRLWSRGFTAGLDFSLSEPLVQPCPYTGILSLDGIFHDEVAAITPTRGSILMGRENWVCLLEWFHLIKSLPAIYHTGENRAVAFWRTLQAGDHLRSPLGNDLRISTQERSRLQGWLTEAKLRCALAFHHSEESDLLRSLPELRAFAQIKQNDDSFPEEVLWYDHWYFKVQARGYIFGRHLFRTAQGYIGLGPCGWRDMTENSLRMNLGYISCICAC